MAEWLKVPVSKTGRRATFSWVQIPLSPPEQEAKEILSIYFS